MRGQIIWQKIWPKLLVIDGLFFSGNVSYFSWRLMCSFQRSRITYRYRRLEKGLFNNKITDPCTLGSNLQNTTLIVREIRPFTLSGIAAFDIFEGKRAGNVSRHYLTKEVCCDAIYLELCHPISLSDWVMQRAWTISALKCQKQDKSIPWRHVSSLREQHGGSEFPR